MTSINRNYFDYVVSSFQNIPVFVSDLNGEMAMACGVLVFAFIYSPCLTAGTLSLGNEK